MATGPIEHLRENDLTDAQKRAVAARGNVLVMAGAGTGKTHTLVERCLNLIRDEKVSLDEILIVTFTEMAAMEMRGRLRAALEDAAGDPADTALAEQLALFDAAHIGTLHSFCFKLVREHFHELGLDPQLSILDEGQARLLADETLEEQFEAHYEKEDAFSLGVQDVIRVYGNGRDEKIRALVLKLHHYFQTRADAESWPRQQIENFSSAEPLQWREWFSEAVSNWQNEWLPLLRHLKAQNIKAGECLDILEKFSGDKTFASLFEKIMEADKPENYPRGKKTAWRKPLEDFFEDAQFLGSLVAGKADPLAEDWGWVRGHMKTLLLLAREFSEKFSARKRADGVVDFHDLEQFAIQLLWDSNAGEPTEIARRWREKLRFVFVDEYQDINASQDRIIAALSGENRFLVGDVKQSIYRFRLANPQIFQDYAKDPRAWKGQTIALAENFRSREALLDFINSLFAPLMREDIGGVLYDDQAKLQFGSRETRDALSRSENPEPRVELLLRAKQKQGGGNSDAEGGEDALGDLQESEKEARMLARRLLELKNSGHQICEDGKFRAADWRDFAVLLRAPGTKAEIFAKQFERAGVPLLVERGGFYESSEISDLLSVLQLADNPLQDVPCVAVLRSPLVGCSMDELAEIRLAGPGHFWFALNQVARSKATGETRRKVENFLERFSRWRKLAQQASLSQCLETVLAETHYDVWLLSRPRGAQRRANVQSFLSLAEQFDEFQRQGLYRFLRFVEAQQEIDAEPEVAPLAEENAVRLMSIHQSKGLEFPVVALADLGKKFNEQDLHSEIILDERFGLCPRVKPPSSGGRYPSLAHWLAQNNQRHELRGEELRLLYVALTRARDTLILSGGVTERKWDNYFQNNAPIAPREILSAGSDMDWLGFWFRIQNAKSKIENPRQGELPALRWRLVDDSELAGSPAEADKPAPGLVSIDKATENRLARVLDWQYPHRAATSLPAKTSVTALRRRAAEADEEAEQEFTSRFAFSKGKRRKDRQLSAEDTGLAHHKFLQHFSFDAATGLKSFAAEAKRLEKENYLSPEEAAVLDVEALADFWESQIGEKIRANAGSVRRELPFTARFGPEELDKISGKNSAADLKDEFIIVQGVADLVVLMPKEIWLVDFKTDDVSAKELPGKTKTYSPQLQLYARALEKIYSRPVTNCWLHFLAPRKTVTVAQ